MAVFGIQLVTTVVMVSVLQKLGQHYSVGRWILCSTGLMRFIHPSDEELKSLAKIPRPKGKKWKDKGSGDATKNGTFTVPCNIDVQLEAVPVNAIDLLPLHFYFEYQWLVDYSIASVIVYCLSELYYTVIPSLQNEINLGLLWCTLGIGFAFKLLFHHTALYFRGSEVKGERSLCLLMGFGFLVISMVVLIIDEQKLELGLDTAYRNLNQSASQFLRNQGINERSPTSLFMVKLLVAMCCAVVGALFTFPGIRFGKMQADVLKYSGESRIWRILFHLSFISPLFLTILWVKPITKDYFTKPVWYQQEEPFLTEGQYDSLRLCCVMLVILFRLMLMPYYLQAYLNIAQDRLEEQRKSAGRISNVDLQKKVAMVFYYLCVVALQFIAPLLICMFLTLILKNTGGYSWVGLLVTDGADTCSADEEPLVAPKISSFDTETYADTITVTSEQFSFAINSLKRMFSQEVWRGLFNFCTWWCIFTWFSTSALGLLYQLYFTS